jgi:hypothetical protein
MEDLHKYSSLYKDPLVLKSTDMEDFLKDPLLKSTDMEDLLNRDSSINRDSSLLKKCHHGCLLYHILMVVVQVPFD